MRPPGSGRAPGHDRNRRQAISPGRRTRRARRSLVAALSCHVRARSGGKPSSPSPIEPEVAEVVQPHGSGSAWATSEDRYSFQASVSAPSSQTPPSPHMQERFRRGPNELLLTSASAKRAASRVPIGGSVRALSSRRRREPRPPTRAAARACPRQGRSGQAVDGPRAAVRSPRGRLWRPPSSGPSCPECPKRGSRCRQRVLYA